MTPSMLDSLIGDLVRRDGSALVHEAAIASWGLDFSATTRAVDLIAPAKSFDALRAAFPISADRHLGNEFIRIVRDGVPIRLWASVGDGLSFADARFVWNGDYARACLEPEQVLSCLPSSPDYQFLLEQRARLAEVLYFDRMSDDELAEFHKYVRGD